jgi:hypothetical protein
MIDHLSASSINSYLTCARNWRFHYVDQVQVPTSPALVFGSAFHDTVEGYVAARAMGDTKIYQDLGLVGLWNQSWTKRTQEAEVAWGADTPEHHANEGLRLLTNTEVARAIEALKPACDGQGAMIERKVELRVPGVPVPVIGYIDMIGADGVPHDFKTASRAWTDDKATAEIQPLVYLAALNQAGANNHRWTFRHVVVTKTKTPQVQVLEHRHRPGEMVWLFGLIQQVWRGIEAETFAPNPTCWKCGPQFCDYFHLCRGKYV